MCIKRNTYYNPDAVKPFLCKTRTVPGKHFFGEAMYAKPEDEDSEYLYHVTKFANFKSIIEHGLLYSYGSSGGAGQSMAGGRFARLERGYIFATNHPYVVDNYIYNYDKFADEDKDSIEFIPILLRFRPLPDEIWIKDTKQKDAVKGQNNILPSRLEFLSFEGWVSLRTIEAQQTVFSIIDSITT